MRSTAIKRKVLSVLPSPRFIKTSCRRSLVPSAKAFVLCLPSVEESNSRLLLTGFLRARPPDMYKPSRIYRVGIKRWYEGNRVISVQNTNFYSET